MRATSGYANNEGFTLNEERLRKLNEILTIRGKEISTNCKPMYKVQRADNLAYETDDIQQVLSEENPEWQKIISLIISMRESDEFLLTLEFRDKDTQLHIEGSNRDTVYLIASDLRQYLSNEVNVSTAPKIPKGLGAVIPMIPATVFLLLLIFLPTSTGVEDNKIAERQIAAETAVASQKIEDKLNYLINKDIQEAETQLGERVVSRPILIAMLSIAAMFFLVLAVFSIIGPTNILSPLYSKSLFLIGKETDRETKRKQLRQNIFWVVVVGFVVSIGAGIVVTVVWTFFQK